MARGNNPSTAHVVITMAGQQAINYMETLAQKAQDVKKELVAMEQAGQMDTKEYKHKVEELKQMQRAVNQNKSAYIDLNETVNNLSKHSLGYLQKALAETRKRMNALNPAEVARRHGDYNKELAKLSAQYRTLDNYIGKLTGQWKRQDGAIMSVLKRLASYVTIYSGFNAIVGGLRKITTSNLQFSDQLADIRKTTGLSTQAVNELSESIMKIDSRQSVQQLHDLAYQAGKLGLGSQGVEGVLGFVKAADKLGVALREDLGDDAIIQLTKMADVMGLTKKMGVEKSLTSIGSAINELSMASTANADFMVNYAQRLSGIASQAHLTADELLGFAAAADATGQEVEVSATAMNKFVVQLQTHYKTVAQAAGINEEALHNMLTMGKTADAVVTVLEALGNKGGLSMLAPLMKDMGSDGARLTASLATMASNIDLVKQQLEISKDAFEENISILNEYNIKNETAAAIMERVRNSWEKLFTNSSNVGVVKELAIELQELSDSIQKNIPFWGTLKLAVGLLIFAIRQLINLTPTLIAFFTMKGIGMAIMGINNLAKSFHLGRVGLLLFSGQATSLTRKLRILAAAFKGLNAATKLNLFVALASAVVGLVTAVATARKELTLAEQNLQSFNEGVKDFEKTSHAAGIEANILFNRLKEADKGSKERKKLMDQINQQYGKYLPNLLTEKSSLEEIATAQETVNTKLRQALALKAKNQAMDEAGQTFTPKMAEATSRMQELYTAAGIEGVGNDDVRFLVEQTQKYYDAGSSFEEIKKKVFEDLYKVDRQFGYSGRSANLVQSGGVLSGQWSELRDAVYQYIANFWNQNKAVERAAKKYDPLIGNYTEKIESGAPYTIVEAEDDKKDKERRAALKEAKDEHKAVMAAIEIYYKQQQQVINDAYLNKKITIAQREQELADIEMRFAESRYAARAFLHNEPGAEEKWYENLTKMQDENLSHTERTNAALKNLWEKDLQDIGDRLRRFGEGEMDGIWKEMETDLTKIQETKIKFAEEVEKILRQYDFEAQVTEKFIAALQKLNIFFPSMTENMKEGAAQAMSDLNAIYPKLFSIDINTSEGVAKFKSMLLEAKGLSADMFRMELEDLQLLYYKTLEYGDAMVEAQEKARDRGVKVGTAAYEQTDQYKGNQKRVKTAEETVNVYKSAEALGLASDIMVQDQEVKLYEARLQAAQDYYNYLQSTGRDTKEAELQLQEATAELASAMVEKTKEQFDVLRSYGKNLEDFGTDFGEAIFGSIDDRRDALEDFVRAIGKTTQELIMNWVKQKIEHAILRKAMVKMEQQAQKQMTGAVEEGQEAEATLVEAGQAAITNAVTQMGAQAVQAKKTQAAESVATGAAETSANATMGIASGAAKTIGQLGWWGIPLVAVITALINGLLSMAMSKVGSLFGGSAQGATAPTKLVTGMLTYDSGNVQSVLGSDGHVYSARVGGVNGSGIVSVPTLTNVGGQAALVGEQGPEIVIGRATTKAMMQNNPALLAGLVSFDKMYSGRGFRTYAGGNVQQYGANGEHLTPEEQEAQQMERIMSVVSATLMPALEGMTRAMNASNRTTAALNERLKLPFNTVINKYGKGGLVDEVASGLEQEKKSGRNETVRRLFGTTKR